jgi:NAD(P)-dependent dehydrogenase (short-subunit alcohol dehydrogenase family)
MAALIDVNLSGAFLPAQTLGAYWIEHGTGGSITFTSSIAGSAGISGLAPYAASKGAVNQLVRTLAVEWARYNIRVNAIAPGYVENIMRGVTAHDDPESEARIKQATPLGRRARIEEIAAAFVFLGSSGASYITGAILPVDGGYTAV